MPNDEQSNCSVSGVMSLFHNYFGLVPAQFTQLRMVKDQPEDYTLPQII